MKRPISSLMIIILLVSTSSCLKEKENQIHLQKEYSYRVDDNAGEKHRDSILKTHPKTATEYSKNGDLIELSIYGSSGILHEQTVYKRNKQGRAESGQKFNASKQLKSQWEYRYDSNDKLLGVKTFDQGRNLLFEQINTYDQEGNLVQMDQIHIANKTTRKTTYAYNAKGERIEQIRYEPNGDLKDSRTYAYDAQGNEIEQRFTGAQNNFIQFLSQYDEQNNLISQRWYTKAGEQTQHTTYTYAYDEFGNWTTKRRYSNGELNMVWERALEYYE